MSKKILISTIYKREPALLAITKQGPDVVYLLVDQDKNAEQMDSVKFIQQSVGTVIKVEVVKTVTYDIVDIARKSVELIDKQDTKDEIYLNVTGGRKTMAIGLLFGAYARIDRIKKIAYHPEEDTNAIVYLPKMSFKLTESQKMVLRAMDKHQTISELAKRVKMSTAMLYRAIGELEDLDMIVKDKGIELTDAGRIARL